MQNVAYLDSGFMAASVCPTLLLFLLVTFLWPTDCRVASNGNAPHFFVECLCSQECKVCEAKERASKKLSVLWLN